MKTAELLSQIPEQPGISLQDFGKGKLGHRIGAIGMEAALNTTLTNVQSRNPYAGTIKLYCLFAEKLPSSISSKAQAVLFNAVTNEDPNISTAGARALTLLNMQTILSAAEPFFTDKPESDGDLIQAGIVHLLENIANKKGGYRLTTPAQYIQYIHSCVQTGIVQEIANQENLPVGWIRNHLHTNVVKLIEESFADHPLGMTKKRLSETAKNISVETRIPEESLLPVLEDRNSLIRETGIMDEEDLVNAASQSELKGIFSKELSSFKERERIVIQARFEEGYTYEETGTLIGRSSARVQQIEAKVLGRLRHPSRSKKLKPYLFPEQDSINKQQKHSPALQEEQGCQVVSLVDGNLVSEARLKYRYPLISCCEIGLWVTGPRFNIISDELAKTGIYNLAQLLTKSDWDLKGLGFTAEEIQKIKLKVTKFLERDARVTTLADTSRQLLDALS